MLSNPHSLPALHIPSKGFTLIGAINLSYNNISFCDTIPPDNIESIEGYKVSGGGVQPLHLPSLSALTDLKSCF